MIKKDPSNKWKMFKVDFLSSSKGPLAFEFDAHYLCGPPQFWTEALGAGHTEGHSPRGVISQPKKFASATEHSL